MFEHALITKRSGLHKRCWAGSKPQHETFIVCFQLGMGWWGILISNRCMRGATPKKCRQRSAEYDNGHARPHSTRAPTRTQPQEIQRTKQRNIAAVYRAFSNYTVRGFQNAVAFCDNSTAEKCYFVVMKRQFLFCKCEKCVLWKSKNLSFLIMSLWHLTFFPPSRFLEFEVARFLRQMQVKMQVKIIHRSIKYKWRSCSVASSTSEGNVA